MDVLRMCRLIVQSCFVYFYALRGFWLSPPTGARGSGVDAMRSNKICYTLAQWKINQD